MSKGADRCEELPVTPGVNLGVLGEACDAVGESL